MNINRHLCRYQDSNNHRCQEFAGASGLCYWHDPKIIKNHPDDKKRLEAYARNGGMLQGISLRMAKLEELDLVKPYGETGFDMSHADLYRANLSGAHLFNLDLSHADLMKTNLRDANLHKAKIENANLLGAKWKGAKIESIKLGDELRQERLANEANKLGEIQIATDYYEQAEEIYRDLRRAAEREGLVGMSANYIRRELTMHRKQMPKYSFERGLSKLIDLFCGYGESPMRVILFSIVLIIICAICFCFTGLSYDGQLQVFNANNSFKENLLLFSNSLYYSVVTFTTLGYGDFTPIGFSRGLAAIEAFTGSFTIALFVVVFVKKMTR